MHGQKKVCPEVTFIYDSIIMGILSQSNLSEQNWGQSKVALMVHLCLIHIFVSDIKKCLTVLFIYLLKFC